MDSKQSRKIFYEHANAMAYLDVLKPDGTRAIGSAFHIGEGIFVTARHVVEDCEVIEIKISEPVANVPSSLGNYPTEKYQLTE